LPSGQERKEGNIIELQINPQRSYSTKFDDSSSYDEYDSDGKSSGAEPKQSQPWEYAQKKEALDHDAHPSPGEHVQ